MHATTLMRARLSRIPHVETGSLKNKGGFGEFVGGNDLSSYLRLASASCRLDAFPAQHLGGSFCDEYD